MEWINIKDKKPIQMDDLFVVMLQSGFTEIIYFNDREKELGKPWAFDKNDIPISRIKDVKFWFKLTNPWNKAI